jgi:hypothetical protein
MFGEAARSRLLPMSVPFRFFGAAVVFHAAAWALLCFFPGDLVAFEGGLGPAFAALHLATLGTLAMAAIGASLQLLPVATRQPVRSVAAVKVAWWLFAPGVALFAAGAALYQPQVMAPGAMLAAAALALYAALLAANLLGARGMKVVIAYGWAALGSLAALAVTGIALVARYEHGAALDYAAFRAAHLIFAAYGFMGLLALGLSNFILPMLALAPPPGTTIASLVLAMALTAIALAVGGFPAAGSLAGLAAAALHVASLERSLSARLRRPLGPAFLLVRVSWGCLLASLALAAAIALGAAPAWAARLFGLLLVPGWLLTFLLGVLQRILPFLGSVHASAAARGTPLISALTPSRALAAHRALHLAALAGLLAAVAAGSQRIAQGAAVLGLAGALLFAGFFAFVLHKVRHHGLEPPRQPAPA